MTAYEVILKKRNGGTLGGDEISFMVGGFVKGSIPDYQMAAFLMAIYFRGLSAPELAHFTSAMVSSGEVMDLSAVPGRKVDKHSSGGVGDKTSLVVGPIVAACGVPVAKMSGRGLGHTGGTLDKLESIPGFVTSLEPERIIAQLASVGLVIAGQTARLAPADGLLYALRDVIAAVDSIPLIASSIMSKKIAGGASAIVLDVKAGNGAFMKTDAAALDLARTMVSIGDSVGRETVALVTGMDEPLGQAVGNSMEVIEAIRTLRNGGPHDLTQLCLEIASEMVALGLETTPENAAKKCRLALENGSALASFESMVRAQGGDVGVVDRAAEILPLAGFREDVLGEKSGCVSGVDAYIVGTCASQLGAGRKKKGDRVDHGVGVFVHKKAGDRVTQGEPLFTVLARTQASLEEARQTLISAVGVFESAPVMRPVVRYRVDARGARSFS